MTVPGSEQKPGIFPGANWIDLREEEVVLDVVRKGALFRYYGPRRPTYAAALEVLAREVYGTRCALAVNGGTGGLITALQALGLGPGAEVIVPAFFWVATVGAVVQCNAIPVLCEVDDSLCMDPEDLERKITARTKLILPVHMAGTPCDMERIMGVARRHGLDVLEDCAQCNGGAFGGRSVGTFGRAGVFSFQVNKNVTAGEGGLIVTNDEALHRRLNAVHDLGVPWQGPAQEVDYATPCWGQGRRISELCAAVAGVQLGKLREIVTHMQSSHRRIRDALAGTPGLALRRLNDAGGDTGPFLGLMFHSAGAARDAACRLTEGGMPGVWRLVDYGLHVYYNVPQLTAKAPLSPSGNPWSLPENVDSVYDYGRGACPQSDDLFERTVLVTVPSRLAPDQEKEMTDRLRAAVS